MSNLTEQLEQLLQWSAPTETTTVRGKAMLRTATPTGKFWNLWRQDKAALQALGISPKLDGETWIVRWYVRDMPAEVPAPAPKREYANNDKWMSRQVAVRPQPVAAKPVSSVQWSEEQVAIFNWFRDGAGSLVVRARAGTGKTTTIKTAFTYAREERMLYAVFNKKNQIEAASAIFDPRVEIKTLHSVGLMFIQSVWPNAKPTDDVEVERVEAVVGVQNPQAVKTQVKKLVGFAKNTFVNPTLEELVSLAVERDVECPEYAAPVNGGWEPAKLAEAALEVLALSKVPDAQNRISFNDMVWLPVAMNWTRAWFDLVVVDEAQDMNLPQLLMAMAACKPSGRVCVVGDDRQSIYGFRGAASNGIDMMKAKLNAAELGLTVTYRCPKAVVQLAQTIVPDYKAAESAPEGLVETIALNAMDPLLAVGDAILSRSNAPLMGVCLSLLRRGLPARIEGKDIGKALLEIVARLNARSVPQFLQKIEAWRDKRIHRIINTKNAEAKIQQVNDQADTLFTVAEGVSSVREIENRLKTLFSDTADDSSSKVVLSTVHKAKGLEWKRVFMLTSTFNRKPIKNGPPVSEAAASAQVREEQNIYYVAVTRAKEHLVMVTGEVQRKN